MKTRTILIFAVGIALMFGRYAFAQTTPYPQQQPTKTAAPAKTAPGKTQSAPTAPKQTQSAPTTPSKTQTAKTETRASQSQFHQAKKEHGHGYSHSGGGVGQPVTARTEEKPRATKKPHEVATTDPFSGVQLTGPQAKAESHP